MFKTRYKLSRELSMAIMLLAAPIFILALGILYVESRYLIHEEVISCTNSTLNTTLQRIENYMNTVETAADANAWMFEENFRPDSLKSVSNRLVRRNPSVVSSSIFAVPDMSQGRTFSIYTIRRDNTVTTYEETEYDYLEQTCYTKPVHSGHACWIDPFVDNTDNKVNPHEAIATYSRPLRQHDGRIVGVLTTDLSFSRMAKILNDVEQPYPHTYYMLLGSDGRYLIHPDSTRLFHSDIFSDADPATDRDIITLGYEMTAGKQGTMHIHYNGEEYHVCYHPVEDTNWSLALVCPNRDAMKSYYHLGYVIIVLLVIGLLVILVLCNHVVKRTISPITKLIETTQQIADGQYYQTIPASPDKGIIGQLQNSFAKMQQSLDERMGSLQQQYETLRQDNETLELAKRQAEDTVSRKNHAIHYMTQQLRMPLNVITGFADVLGENSADNQMMNEEELNNVQVLMKNNVVSLDRMLLMMSDATSTDATETLRSDKTDEVSCNKVAHQSISVALSHYPQASIQFETELQDTACILANHNHLAFILCELLYNAAKHSDGKHIVLRVTQTKDSVLFTLQDKGPGLPADLDLTYRPFTTEMAKSLGLPLVNRYTVVMGGTLTIDTDYHEGCRVTVSLPR